MCCWSEQKAPEGSWKCDNCGNINYPFRNKCNRQNCGADKPGDHSNESPSDAPEENNQVRYATYLCSHICLLINCLLRKLADVTVRLDFMSSESSGYLFMKKSTQSVESKISERYVFSNVWSIPVSLVWGLRRVSDRAGVGNVSQILRQVVVHVAAVVKLLLCICLFYLSVG